MINYSEVAKSHNEKRTLVFSVLHIRFLDKIGNCEPYQKHHSVYQNIDWRTELYKGENSIADNTQGEECSRQETYIHCRAVAFKGNSHCEYQRSCTVHKAAYAQQDLIVAFAPTVQTIGNYCTYCQRNNCCKSVYFHDIKYFEEAFEEVVEVRFQREEQVLLCYLPYPSLPFLVSKHTNFE